MPRIPQAAYGFPLKRVISSGKNLRLFSLLMQGLREGKPLRVCRVLLVLWLWLLAISPVPAAEPAPIRLAIGPFFAPTANESLQKAADALPDLLLAELSHQRRFQLVERDKINAVWEELHLNSSGLTASDTIARFGKMLDCDWLVSGSLIAAGAHTQAWTKLIDIRNAIVLDLEALPYETTNLAATVIGIADFLSKAGTRPQRRQFLTLGRFTDLSVSSAHEDWSRRLPAIIEKHFHAAGIGVVEREAVAPIFEEYQLESAGLTGQPNGRVKLQPAFWIVDGGCKWVYDTQDKISVALRVQKVGTAEQIYRFTAVPGPELEKAVIQNIEQAMAKTNSIPWEQAATQEAKIHETRGMEMAERRAPMTPVRPSSRDAEAEVKNRFEENRRATLASYEKAILLDPKNLRAKTMLGYALLADPVPTQRERGKDLLREVVASHDPKYSDTAQRHLTNADLYFQIMFNKKGAAISLTNQPAQTLAQPVASAKPTPETSVIPKATIPALPMPRHVASFPTMTAVHASDEILIASGTVLHRYDIPAGVLEKIELPPTVNQPIISVASDGNSYWLGTAGGGLFQISKSGKPPRIYAEKDGLLMPSISALCRFGDRLWLGFGFRENGGCGYLEFPSGKFVGLAAEAGIFKSGRELLQGPPDCAVSAIKTSDKKTLWISSGKALHRYDIASQKWSVALPGPHSGVSVNSNFVAVGCSSGGVMICKLPGEKWERMTFGPQFSDNFVFVLRVDDERLWVGGFNRIRLIDMSKLGVVGECKFMRHRVRWLAPAPEVLWIVADGPVGGTSSLFYLTKPSL